MQCIAITGADGFIGCHLARQLRQAGFAGDVRLFDRAFGETPQDEAIALDLAAPDAAAHVLQGADCVIHLAAMPGGAAEGDTAGSRAINVDFPLSLIEGMDGRRLILASSIAVLGSAFSASVDDQTIPRAQSVYGTHKRMVELAFADAMRREALAGFCLRLPGIVARPAGATGFGSAFLSEVFHAAREGRHYTVPVSPEATSWLMSANICARNLAHAALCFKSCGQALTLPALHIEIGELVERLIAPMPRAWQWRDGSAYPAHGALMDEVIGVTKPKIDFPLMYQGASDKFYGPREDVILPDEALGIDFEGEFGIMTDFVPMGTKAAGAMKHIKLLVQINDWSLRNVAAAEMQTGFGWVWAKPHCSMAPFAVTPEELGDDWRDGRICLDLLVDWNGTRFGAANGEPMEYGFHELVERAARTRDLVPGTVVGSGTVSNTNFRQVGSSCIAERRGIEIVDEGAPRTEFMKFGDTVRMQAVDQASHAPFGAIDQRVIRSGS